MRPSGPSTSPGGPSASAPSPGSAPPSAPTATSPVRGPRGRGPAFAGERRGGENGAAGRGYPPAILEVPRPGARPFGRRSPVRRRLTMRSRSLRLAPLALLLAAAAPAPEPWLPGPEPALAPFPVAGPLEGVRLEQVATGVGSIPAVTHAGDARLFVTLRDGRVVIVAGSSVRATPFLDLRGQVSQTGERGLLSTAFHPRHAENGLFFVYYSNLSGESVVALFRVGADPDRADPASARTLLTISQPFINHQGGQMAFGPDGYLYVGLGDGGAANDPACRAQRDDTLLGKLLRLDVDANAGAPPFYGIPAGNPFRGPGNPPDEIWASGLRNPWRFSFDRLTGDLWIGDVGQGQREEIDFQPAGSGGGENYGWKVM